MLAGTTALVTMTGPIWQKSTRYLRKYGMGLTVWWPLYSVEKESRVAREHPDWLTNPSAPADLPP